MTQQELTAETGQNRSIGWETRRPVDWMHSYLRWAALADGACALAAGVMAVELRFVRLHELPVSYVVFSGLLPVLWWMSLAMAGGYDARFIGVGSEEFHRVLNAGIRLTAAVAIISYALKLQVARGYIALAMPSALLLQLAVRYARRKRLHRLRSAGRFGQRVVAVGHAPAVADLIATLCRDSYHGMSVVGACVMGQSALADIAGVPVCGSFQDVSLAVKNLNADTVAVLACPELNAIQLRTLAWQLEETRTDLCVAAALLDVAGPRTTIRPVAGLPLLHVDHPELGGARLAVKGAFDRFAAAIALIAVSPVLAGIAVAIRSCDRGPVFFRQTRVGRGGRTFSLIKFRTMVVDAEQRRADLEIHNDASGVLFKLRRDPRVTRVGAWLRRWSLDELPQLINVLAGDMSLVGPRPPLPSEAARYDAYVRRRLVVKPGITGLWQVSGRSDLPWEEAVRLDLRYVENWSFTLDLQILWKTMSAVARGSGAY